MISFKGQQVLQHINVEQCSTCQHHSKEKIFKKASRGIGVIHNYNGILPRETLLTICKSFPRSFLDYGDKICDQSNNKNFCQQIDVKYKAALATTGTITSISRTKFFEDISLESLKFRKWHRKLCSLLKIKAAGLPYYLSKYILKENHQYNTRLQDESITTYQCRSNAFRNHFLFL